MSLNQYVVRRASTGAAAASAAELQVPKIRTERANSIPNSVAADRANSVSSNSSVHSNFTERLASRQSIYEPGTGAHFMAEAGWNKRDQYGRPRPSVCYTPTVRRNQQPAIIHPHHAVKLKNGPDYETYYLVALVIVSLLFLLFIITTVILFITKVFVINGPGSGNLLVPGSHPPAENPTTTVSTPHQTLIPLPLPTSSEPPALLHSRFQLEFYIKNQANPAYANPASSEHQQATHIIHNAILDVVEASALKEMTPTLELQRIVNSGNDLQVQAQISIASSNAKVDPKMIESLFRNQMPRLEQRLNHTTVDKTRIEVKQI